MAPAGPGLGSPPACSPWEPGGEQHHCVPPRPVLLTWGCPAGEARGCAARPGTALSNSTRAPVCVCVAAAASCLPPPPPPGPVQVGIPCSIPGKLAAPRLPQPRGKDPPCSYRMPGEGRPGGDSTGLRTPGLGRRQAWSSLGRILHPRSLALSCEEASPPILSAS